MNPCRLVVWFRWLPWAGEPHRSRSMQWMLKRRPDFLLTACASATGFVSPNARSWLRSGSPRRTTVQPRSSKVEAVLVHDVVPGRHEVPHERLLRIVLPVDLCNRPELRVRAEDEVDAGAAPLQFARCAVASFERIPLPAALSLGKWKGHKRGPSRSGLVRLDPEESSRRPHPHGLVPANCGHPPATPVAVDGTDPPQSSLS